MGEKDVIKNRYDFMILVDVENGNPNGDPDAGGLPRIDPETGIGLLSDVSIKRKIRNYVDIAKDGKEGYRIYIKQGRALESNDKEALSYIGVDDVKNLKRSDPGADERIRDFMCQNFWDVRTFGAVMATFMQGSLNCGQVQGPVQISMGKSVDPIITQEMTLTRVAITREKDLLTKNTEMGRKSIVPYGLYVIKGYISPYLAKKTGFSEEDLGLLWETIINMFDVDHSATRGNMACRALFVFKHENELGKAPAYKLFDKISIKAKVESPRSFSDYEVAVDKDMPEGVTFKSMI